MELLINMLLLVEKLRLLVENAGLGATEPRSEMVRQRIADGVAASVKSIFIFKRVCVRREKLPYMLLG